MFNTGSDHGKEEMGYNAIRHPEFVGKIGVGRVDITPPVGIFSRSWGSSVHDVASGIHKPLYATSIMFSSSETGLEQFLISVDLSFWKSNLEEWEIRSEILGRSGLDESQLLLHLSHSHSVPMTNLINIDKPGGHLIPQFREKIISGIVEAVAQARQNSSQSCLSWSYGTCRLAVNRDQPIVIESKLTTIVGLNPDQAADDTLLVGRVVDTSGNIRAVLVNYACHPVSLGGGNTEISPDYVGRMREVVEEEGVDAVCVFMHGASGELTPRTSYSSEPSSADKNGQELGYAVLETLTSMLPAEMALAHDRVEQSGAPLGHWSLKLNPASAELAIEMVAVELNYRDLPTLEELDAQIGQEQKGYMIERLQRRRLLRQELGDKNSRIIRFPVWILGNSALVALNGEAYSAFQILLRKRFPTMAVGVMNIVNGYFSYFPSEDAYDLPDCYQVNVAFFEKGCMEKIVNITGNVIGQLTETV